MKDNGFRRIQPPRPLEAVEAALVRLLLSEDFPGRETYREQLPRLRVWSECTCGCRTLDLCLEGEAGLPGLLDGLLPVEGEGSAPDGTPIMVLLHTAGDQLAELEIVRADSAPLEVVPPPDCLRLIHPERSR